VTHTAVELPREVELLILSARQSATDAQHQRIRELTKSELDWDTVLKNGRSMGVQTLLRRQLQAADASLVPPAVSEFLEQEYRIQAIANLKWWHQLQEIGEAISQLRIRVVLLKGAFLAYSVYEDPALRPMADLDLLCRRQDWTALNQALEQLGYTQLAKVGDLNPFTSHRTFIRPKSLPVEVHLNLDCALTPEEAVERSEKFSAASPFFALQFDHMVQHLIAHMANHFRAGSLRLVWFTDIYEAAARTNGRFQVKAKMLYRQAQRSPSGPAIWAFLTRYWLSSPVGVRTRLSASHAEILGPLQGQATVPVLRYLDPVRKVWNYPGVQEKMRYLRWLFFPPASYLIQRGQLEPGANVFLHYVRRTVLLPARLVRSALAAHRSNRSCRARPPVSDL